MSVQIILEAHDRAEFTLPVYFIREVLSDSLFDQALTLEPDVKIIPIPNACVTPLAMKVLVNLSKGFEPIKPNPEWRPAAIYLNCERLLVYSEPSYSGVSWQDVELFFKWVVEEKAICVVRYAIRKGLNPSKETALAAIAADSPEIVRELLNCQTVHQSILVSNDWEDAYRSVLKWACEKGYLDIAEIAASHLTPWDWSQGLNVAARSGYLEIVKFLLDNPKVNPNQDEGAITSAAQYGHIEIVKVLLADPRVDPTIQSNVAIRLAVFNKDAAMIELLDSNPRVRQLGGYEI